MTARSEVPELDGRARGARRLGVLGGSFDPPHRGHLHAADAARGAFALDHVLLVPAARPPHKPGRQLASGADRAALLSLLAAGDDGLSVWTGELSREGPSYSVDTARALRRARGQEAELFWILGSDNLPGLAGWREAEELLRLAQPIVIFRAGDPLELGDEVAGLSEPARARLAAGLVAAPPMRISSTELRRRLAAGEDPGEELPEDLREYIAARGIYRAA
ncbi:MAG: nicotinate (nicotinamide) nucleotide adenylyltransferase [Planctomycetota bacterium]